MRAVFLFAAAVRSSSGPRPLAPAGARPPAGLGRGAPRQAHAHAEAVLEPTLASIDLNPILAMPEGQGAYALDAVIELNAGEARADGH